MSNDEGNKPRSLREIAARAKEARSGAAPSASASELLGALQARPSVPPPGSAPPGTLEARPSQPPERLSSPPSVRPSSPPSVRSSSPPERVSSPPAPSSSPATVSVPPATMRTPETSSAKAEASAEPAQEPAAPAPAHEQRSVTPILVGVGLVAVLGLGVVLTRKSEPTSVPLGGTTTAISAEIKTTAAPEPKASAPAEPASAAPAPAESGVVDINALGAEPSAKAAPRASGPLHKPGDPPDGPVAPATAPPTAEPPASAAPRPMGSVGDLKDEMRKRVGATDQPSDQPDDSGPAKNPNAKQEKPSNAAVLGALGAVRGAVKSCISDLDKPVRISVTFQSDGSVRSVTVSGAGKAESCVQAAVKKARVAPFMNDSFSTSFSVSP